MWLFDKDPVPASAPTCPGRTPASCSPATRLRVAVVHPRLPAGRRPRQRGRHPGRGRQPVPRLHRRHRRHRHRALPPGGRRRHPGPGRQAASTCRGTDFYYRPQIDLAERLAEAGARAGAQEGVLHQQRRRGARGGPEAGPLAHAAQPRASRSSAPSTAAPTGPCRCPARSSSTAAASRRWCRTSTTSRSRATARLRDRRRPAPASGEIEETVFKRDGPAGRGRGHLRRADPGRGRLPRRRRRASCRRCGPVRQARHPAGRRRGADRAWAAPGKMFAVEHWGVEPDIICLAKGIASGHAARGDHRPAERDGLAAAAATPARSAATRSAAGRPWRRIDLLEREYMANAAARGEQLRARACASCEAAPRAWRRPRPGADDGRGLLIGRRRARPGRPRRGRPGGVPPRAAAAGLRRDRDPLLPAAVRDGGTGRDVPADTGRGAGGGPPGRPRGLIIVPILRGRTTIFGPPRLILNSARLS